MTTEELRQLSRNDLAELLVKITQENEQLRRSLDEARQQLDDRAVMIEDPGNMAEAARLVTAILLEAQVAAQQQLDLIRLRDQQQRQFCQRLEQNAQKKCRRIQEEAKAQADAYLQQLRACLRSMNDAYPWETLGADGDPIL